jgi:hypothetical protein
MTDDGLNKLEMGVLIYAYAHLELRHSGAS